MKSASLLLRFNNPDVINEHPSGFVDASLTDWPEITNT
jgi:hypothetical protein